MKQMVSITLVTVLLVIAGYGQTRWVRYTDAPVLQTTPGDWDQSGLGGPFVMEWSDTLWMYYQGFNKIPFTRGGIGLAWSVDAINWTKYDQNPIIQGPLSAWDGGTCRAPYVVTVDSDSLVMIYTGENSDLENGQIGLATAKHPKGPWERYALNPIITLNAAGETVKTVHSGGGIYFDGTEYVLLATLKYESGQNRILQARSSNLVGPWTFDPSSAITSCEPAKNFDGALSGALSSTQVGTMQYLLYSSKEYENGIAMLDMDQPGHIFTHSPWNPLTTTEPVGHWDNGLRVAHELRWDEDQSLFECWYIAYDGSTPVSGDIALGYATSLLGYRGLDTLDIDNAILRVRYEGSHSTSLIARLHLGEKYFWEIELFDDGQHEDLQALDNIFGCRLPNGEYRISIVGVREAQMMIEYWEVEDPIVIINGTVDRDQTVHQLSQFRLNQNYPNPFNPSTTITYSLQLDSEVNLTIYDVVGNEVVALVHETKPAGEYEVVWNRKDTYGRNVSTGVYFCRLQAGDHEQTIKMVFLK